MPMKSSLQNADAQLKELVRALKAENKKLNSKLAKVEAQKLTLQNSLAAKEKELQKCLKRQQTNPLKAIRMIVVKPNRD